MMKYPHCSTFADLVAAVRGTVLYDPICNAYLDSRAKKLWTLARDDVAPSEQNIDLIEMLHKLPDQLPNTISPEQTLALLNA